MEGNRGLIQLLDALTSAHRLLFFGKCNRRPPAELQSWSTFPMYVPLFFHLSCHGIWISLERQTEHSSTCRARPTLSVRSKAGCRLWHWRNPLPMWAATLRAATLSAAQDTLFLNSLACRALTMHDRTRPSASPRSPEPLFWPSLASTLEPSVRDTAGLGCGGCSAPTKLGQRRP